MALDGGARARTIQANGGSAHFRILALLAAVTAIGSTGLAAGGTAGALLAVELTGTHALAGLPVAVHLAGSAVGALFVSHQAGIGHRGRGLALGFAIGAVGAAVVVGAAVAGNFAVLLVGSALLGTANSSIFLARYAGVAEDGGTSRGRALGAVFLATAVGAIISPTLLGPSSALARGFGLPPLTGLYLVAIAAFGAAALLLAVAANPRMPWVGFGARLLTTGRANQSAGFGMLRSLTDPGTRLAVLVLAGNNFVMVGIMTIAPIHLTAHGHGLEVVGGVVALHVLGMFGPSPVTGYLADKFGARLVVFLGGVLLAVGGVAGMFADEHGTFLMTVHLLLVGLGWNCGVVGGSTMLTETVSDEVRPHSEGVGEAAMGTAAAVVAPLAGIVSQLGGYGVLCLCAVALVVAALPWLRPLGHDRVARPSRQRTVA